MANPTGKGGFKKGQSGNPAGKPKGSRHKLNETFILTLAADFQKHGTAAIKTLREKDLGTYMRIVANLQPKEIEAAGPDGGAIPITMQDNPRELARRLEVLLTMAGLAEVVENALDR